MNRKLKAKIVERFESQANFSQAIKTDESIISRVIRGRRELTPANKKLWCQALKCEPEDIFFNEVKSNE